MGIRGFVGLAFVLNLLFSNVCVMGTAYAATPAAGADERFLSREVPMSFNVVTCSWVKTDEGWRPAADSPCASGHCLKKEKPDSRCLFSSVGAAHPAFAAALPAYEPRATDAPNPKRAPRRRHGPPYPGLRSTVLRT